MRIHLLLLTLVLTLAACDYGDGEGLVLDGTYRGTGQSQIANGVASTGVTVIVRATFDDATVGALTTTVTVEVGAGSVPESFSGTLAGTLASDGTLSFGGTLNSTTNQMTFNASGNATTDRIEVDATGTLPVSNLVLTR